MDDSVEKMIQLLGILEESEEIVPDDDVESAWEELPGRYEGGDSNGK